MEWERKEDGSEEGALEGRKKKDGRWEAKDAFG